MVCAADNIPQRAIKILVFAITQKHVNFVVNSDIKYNVTKNVITITMKHEVYYA